LKQGAIDAEHFLVNCPINGIVGDFDIISGGCHDD
jgi:hypothetical protein